ncbi:MAG TPA: 3-deoxy-manno-octulosonate cytidylyltransferase [Burkholderiaceae bacterium]|nr:3-deoxy-manno-octulosonate cytidylyltransferase [Burkholderiaceae bacterium]
MKTSGPGADGRASGVPDFFALIPARLASTRLPEKPLADLGGLPMVVRVARQAAASGALRVVVCADDRRIQESCRQHGVESILTAPAHPTGTDRLAEAVSLLGLDASALIVNVQGDEPLIEPATIASVARLLQQRPECDVATVAHPLQRVEELFDPNVVKVVTDATGLALLFSRAPIPWSREHFGGAFGGQRIDHWPDDLAAMRHVGLYAYRVGFLQRFRQLSPAPIELAEKLEQLRALWHGVRIAVMRIDSPMPPGVDTPEDLARVRAMLAAAP